MADTTDALRSTHQLQTPAQAPTIDNSPAILIQPQRGERPAGNGAPRQSIYQVPALTVMAVSVGLLLSDCIPLIFGSPKGGYDPSSGIVGRASTNILVLCWRATLNLVLGRCRVVSLVHGATLSHWFRTWQMNMLVDQAARLAIVALAVWGAPRTLSAIRQGHPRRRTATTRIVEVFYLLMFPVLAAVSLHRFVSFLMFHGVLDWLAAPGSPSLVFDLGDLILFDLVPLLLAALFASLTFDMLRKLARSI